MVCVAYNYKSKCFHPIQKNNILSAQPIPAKRILPFQEIQAAKQTMAANQTGHLANHLSDARPIVEDQDNEISSQIRLKKSIYMLENISIIETAFNPIFNFLTDSTTILAS